MTANGVRSVGRVDSISPYPANFSTLECICLRTNIHSSNFSTYGNEIGTGGYDPGQDGMVNTSMLARIPIVVDPVTRMVYFTDNGNDMYHMFLQTKHLDKMTLAITDDAGRHIAESVSGPYGQFAHQADAGLMSFRLVFKWEALEISKPPPRSQGVSESSIPNRLIMP